jgi:hypothetical protein
MWMLCFLCKTMNRSIPLCVRGIIQGFLSTVLIHCELIVGQKSIGGNVLDELTIGSLVQCYNTAVGRVYCIVRSRDLEMESFSQIYMSLFLFHIKSRFFSKTNYFLQNSSRMNTVSTSSHMNAWRSRMNLSWTMDTKMNFLKRVITNLEDILASVTLSIRKCQCSTL